MRVIDLECRQSVFLGRRFYVCNMSAIIFMSEYLQFFQYFISPVFPSFRKALYFAPKYKIA
jgi:hypothetical protein